MEAGGCGSVGVGRMRARLVTSTLAVLFVLAVPPAGAAEYDPVASGATTLTISAPFAKLLASHHVSIQAKGGAKRRGPKIVLPASGGDFDPVLGTGTVESEGTIVFVSGKRRVPFRAIVFKAKRSPFYARVGGTQFKVAGAKRLSSKREGFGVGFTATGLRLSAKVATRLDKKLRLGKAIQPGQEIGVLTSRVAPRTVHLLPQNRVALALDPAFVAKLNKLFVSLNPIAPAELGPGPTLSFPIGPESALAPDGTTGLIKTGGSVELLQLGSAQIFWREVWLEPGAAVIAAEADVEPSPPKAGRQPQAPLLSFPAGGQLVADPAAGTIVVSGRGVTLTAATAEALDSSFAEGKPTFVAGESVGTISFTAQAH